MVFEAKMLMILKEACRYSVRSWHGQGRAPYLPVPLRLRISQRWDVKARQVMTGGGKIVRVRQDGLNT